MMENPTRAGRPKGARVSSDSVASSGGLGRTARASVVALFLAPKLLEAGAENLSPLISLGAGTGKQ